MNTKPDTQDRQLVEALTQSRHGEAHLAHTLLGVAKKPVGQFEMQVFWCRTPKLHWQVSPTRDAPEGQAIWQVWPTGDRLGLVHVRHLSAVQLAHPLEHATQELLAWLVKKPSGQARTQLLPSLKKPLAHCTQFEAVPEQDWQEGSQLTQN